MSTAYTTTAGGNPAMTGTAAATGVDFVLATGAARVFFTVPPLSTGESLELQIKETNGGSYVKVGTICNNGDSVGVVTSRGGGSTFRVNKSATGESVAVFFD
jgi:hypothetical protein